MSSIATATIALAVLTFIGSVLISCVSGYSIKKNNDQALRSRRQIIMNRNMDYLKFKIEMINHCWKYINKNFNTEHEFKKLYEYFDIYHSHLISKSNKWYKGLNDNLISNNSFNKYSFFFKIKIMKILEFETNTYNDSLKKNYRV